MITLQPSLLLFLAPYSALAGGSVSVSIMDLGRMSGVESLNIQGNYDCQIADKINGKASYVFNKDRFMPAGLSASSSTDTEYGKLSTTVSVDPQKKAANVEATLRNEGLGVFSTNFRASDQEGGMLGPVKWTSKPVAFPFALGEATPMVIGIAHDINTKEGHLSITAKMNSNFDGKLMLPSEGDPVATLMASHSPDKKSDIRASANILDLLGSGVGKGSIGVTYRRDLDTVPGSSSKVTLEGKDTGDFAWSLSNATKRMTLVLSGRGRFARPSKGGGVSSTVSLRQSFRLF